MIGARAKRDGLALRSMKPRDNLPGRPKRRGGRRSRDKGNRGERAIVAILQDSGFAAERVPLSGSAGGKNVGDVTIPLLGRDMCAEVKVRAHGFGQLYAWLDGREILIVRQDRREPLVILPLRLAAEIAGYAERNSQESRPDGELARLLLAQAIEQRANEH
jgi:Holliday junction resolvase